MNIQNIECRFLKVNSSSFETAYNNNNLGSVEVTATFNDDDPVTKTLVIPVGNPWVNEIIYDDNTVITQFYLRNIFTNQKLGIIQNTYPVTTQGLIDFKDEVTTTLTNLNISAATQSSTLVDNLLTYSVGNMPHYIIPDSIVIEISGYPKTEYFSNVEDEDYIASNNNIYLKPSFFGKESFDDGIVHVKTVVYTADNSIVTEETCFFVDCSIRQSLAENIDIEQCKATDVEILMLHYSLVQASNHDCDCEAMHEIFEYLSNNLETTNNNPCGC